jgi:UPF0755 protein
MNRVEIIKQNKKRWRNNNVVLLLILIAAALAVLMLLALIGGRDQGAGGEATISIPEGATTTDIATLLLEEDVIEDEADFLARAADAGIDQQLQAGIYVFQRGESLDEILNKLKEGLQDPEAVLTIPEGYSIYDIADLVMEKTDVSREEYLAAIAVDGRELPLEGTEGALDLEGFLFPSTYNIDPEFDVDMLVDRQLESFTDETAAIEWEKAAGLGMTEYETLIVASMVEREAKVDAERPLVAAVIYNRINQGMKLEIDATVQYALGYWKEELTAEDLAVDSLFNTRLYGGLPPGPICNPGIASINAALNPASVNYLFYVATGDDAGTHTFTDSYEEFLAAGG